MSRCPSRTALWSLIVAALFVRALVPSGWMPDTGRTDVIIAKMCNADFTVRIPLKREKAPDRDGHQAQEHCVFGGLAGAGMLPALPVVPIAPPPAHQLRIATLVALDLVPPGHILPPGRGPPLRT